jgi:preprotein translocase subunit SecG
MLGLWAVLTLTAALYSVWLGYGGRAFAVTLTAFAVLFLVILLFAARGVADRLASRFGGGSAYLLGTAVFLVYLIYALGTNTFAFTRVAAVAALVFIPLALAASAQRKPPGAWQDFATILFVWLAVKPLPNRWGWSLSHWLWPYPGGRLAYIFTILLCVNVALACFFLLRRVSGVGYSPSAGATTGASSSWQVSSSSAVSPFHWARPCTSFNSNRSGRN